VSRLDALLAAFTEGDLSAAAACFAPAASYREAGRAAISGAPAIAAHFARFAQRAQAWRFTVDDVIVSGSRACVVFRYAANEGDGAAINERAGCAVLDMDPAGFIESWREYEG
jgi:ketosteroid isomerase-like protein